MKLIIVEGIDRVGKTTLCKAIKDIFSNTNVAVCHDGFFSNYNMTTQVAIEKTLTTINILESLEDVNGIFVLDRFYFSEIVYSKIERDNNSKSYFTILDKKVAQFDPILILMRSEDIRTSSNEHGKDLSKHEHEFLYLKNSWTSIKDKYCLSYKGINDFVVNLKY